MARPGGLGTGHRRRPDRLVTLLSSLSGTAAMRQRTSTHPPGNRWRGTVPKGRSATARRVTRKAARTVCMVYTRRAWVVPRPPPPTTHLESQPDRLPSREPSSRWGEAGLRQAGAAGPRARSQGLTQCLLLRVTADPLRSQIPITTPSQKGCQSPRPRGPRCAPTQAVRGCS